MDYTLIKGKNNSVGHDSFELCISWPWFFKFCILLRTELLETDGTMRFGAVVLFHLLIYFCFSISQALVFISPLYPKMYSTVDIRTGLPGE